MARRWTVVEEEGYKAELLRLYVNENKTIDEIGEMLAIAPQTVFSRLQRLGIPSSRNQKIAVNNKRSDTVIPHARSAQLAELFGILLGDGHISHFQVLVTLGNKELAYARHVQALIREQFGGTPRIATRASGHRDVYLGCTTTTAWLLKESLVHNKVSAQVGAPSWIFGDSVFMASFLRGFFDTDGSVYALRYGIQVSFCNRSVPLLLSLQKMLRTLGYTPSAISGKNLYLTKRHELDRFFGEIRPANSKHVRRYKNIVRRVGTEAVKRDAL